MRRPDPLGEVGPPVLEALTSDLWYTLVYVAPAERRRLEAARRRAWLQLLQGAGVPSGRAAALWLRLRRWADRQESLGHAPAIPAQVDWIARRGRCSLPEGPVTQLLDDIADGARISVAPGSLAALRRLRDEGWRLGIVSNVTEESSEATYRILERAGLLGCVDSIRLSSDLPWSKPHPGPYRASLADLGVAPSAAAHVGDLASDLLGARRAGMTPIWFTGLHRMEFPAGLPSSVRPDPAVCTVGSWPKIPQALTAGRSSPMGARWGSPA